MSYSPEETLYLSEEFSPSIETNMSTARVFHETGKSLGTLANPLMLKSGEFFDVLLSGDDEEILATTGINNTFHPTINSFNTESIRYVENTFNTKKIEVARPNLYFPLYASSDGNSTLFIDALGAVSFSWQAVRNPAEIKPQLYPLERLNPYYIYFYFLPNTISEPYFAKPINFDFSTMDVKNINSWMLLNLRKQVILRKKEAAKEIISSN